MAVMSTQGQWLWAGLRGGEFIPQEVSAVDALPVSIVGDAISGSDIQGVVQRRGRSTRSPSSSAENSSSGWAIFLNGRIAGLPTDYPPVIITCIEGEEIRECRKHPAFHEIQAATLILQNAVELRTAPSPPIRETRRLHHLTGVHVQDIYMIIGETHYIQV